jgi:hypothetical protein
VEFLDGGEDRDGVFRFGFGGTCRIGFDRRHERDSLAVCFEIAIDTKMVAAECARTDYGNTANALVCDCYAPLPSTARRQRV